jgi:aryl-alcohol dehydrogenase-like predicted oxidoreductase
MEYGIANDAGKPGVSVVAGVLDLAKRNSITYLDTANAYGDSEKRLGEYGIQNFRVISKFMPETVSGPVESQFQNSLSLLKANKIYGYLSHRPEELLQNPAIWQKLVELREQHKIEKIGFSLDRPDDLRSLLEKNFIPDLVQIPYNYLDRRFEPMFSELKNLKVEIHTRSAFLQGLFFLKKIPAQFNEIAQITRQLQRTVSELPSALIQFVLNNKHVDVAIIGVQNAAQLEQLLAGLNSSQTLPELNQQVSEDILMPSRWRTT